MANDNLPPDVADAMEYLSTGGLGEVIGFTELFASRGEPRVSCDTDMMLALLYLAAEALNARKAPKDPGHDRD